MRTTKKTQVAKNKEKVKKGVGDGTNKENGGDNSVFASCSFSSLGLHPTLCDQLRGNLLFRVVDVVNHNSTHGHAIIVQSFNLLRMFR